MRKRKRNMMFKIKERRKTFITKEINVEKIKLLFNNLLKKQEKN